MNELYKNKYRIESVRLKGWNYSDSASYFITICTANRAHFFGEITNGKMNLSLLGKIVGQEWLKSVELRPDMNLSLGEYIVMPNHFHGIIFIGENKYNTPTGLAENEINDRIDHNGIVDMDGIDIHCISRISVRDAMHGVSNGNTGNTGNTRKTPTKPSVNQFAPQSKNLASVVRGFKSAVTTFARKNNIEFDWQSRFHDHIIRNEIEYQRISNYILNNPLKWNEDKFNG